MDILLVNPFYHHQSYARLPPVGLCSIARHLAQNGLRADVLDLQVHPGPKALERRVEETRPRMVGIGGTTQTRFEAFRIADMIKATAPTLPVVYGGHHASAAAKDVLSRIQSIDYVVSGMGEAVMLKLLRQGQEKGADALDGIPGIAYRQNGAIKTIPAQEELCVYGAEKGESLLDMVDVADYPFYLPFQRQKAAIIYASIGCPRDCIFCSAKSILNRRYVKKPPEQVVDEMVHIHARNRISHFFFSDNDLAADEENLVRLCEKILETRLPVRWECKARPDSLDRRLLALMKKAGCHMIDIGIESGSQRILEVMHKHVSLERIVQVLSWVRGQGIRVKAFFIVGHPSETFDEAVATLEFMKRYERAIDIFDFYPGITIYPGTEVERLARENGCLPGDFHWAKDYYCAENLSLGQDPFVPVFIQDTMGFVELRRLYVSFMRQCLRRPRFLLEKALRARDKSQFKKYMRVCGSLLRHGHG